MNQDANGGVPRPGPHCVRQGLSSPKKAQPHVDASQIYFLTVKNKLTDDSPGTSIILQATNVTRKKTDI